HRLLQAAPWPRRRAALQRRRLLGPAHPRHPRRHRPPRRRGRLRCGRLPPAPRLPEEARRPARAAHRLRHRHVLLPHHGGVSESVPGLQRLPGRRRHPGHLPQQPHAALRHQRRHLGRGPEPPDHPGLLGELPAEEGRRLMPASVTRRRFLAGAALAGVGLAAGLSGPPRRKALVAVTLDLEMSRNFPSWNDTHWDYEKGNLNEESKKYTVAVCKRLQAAGGVAHLFAVGRTFEQESVAWLKDLARAGHPVGNHTYDHVNVLARRPEEIQFRFNRAPWLVEGKTPADVIRDNVRLTSTAMRTRLGIAPAGFRTPGGFANGLTDRPDVRRMLRDQGFRWVSSKY